MKFHPKFRVGKIIANTFIGRGACQTVRVRFAPSPTGHLHLGGLRTALYNYFFAQKNKGQFIVRIEDTDQTRLVNGAARSILDDLLWCGLEIHEGPEFGGKYGPYTQSQRRHIYKQAVNQLVRIKAAYPCFCTPSRLNMMRREALKMGLVPKYDNKCRYLTPMEVKEKTDQGIPYCIRLKYDKNIDSFNDIIYGNISLNVENEGDPVIVKTDGYPTYHFANVVDDHEMKITHVFRGVEWHTSTPKHLLLYQAFGWQPPKYGHLPLLLNPDGSKLSKRQSDMSVRQFRDNGIFPLALVNYVTTSGGGFNNHSQRERVINGFKTLIESFNIHAVKPSPAKLNHDLLLQLNGLEIQRRLSDTNAMNKMIEIVRQHVTSTYPAGDKAILKDEYIRNAILWSANRITTLRDLTAPSMKFLWVGGSKIKTNDFTSEHVKDLIMSLSNTTFKKANIQDTLKTFANDTGLKFPQFMQTLRNAISGLTIGPGVAEIMEILGKEIVLSRIQSNITPIERKLQSG